VRKAAELTRDDNLDDIKETMISFSNDTVLPTNWPSNSPGTFLCFGGFDNKCVQMVFGNIYTDYNLYLRTTWGASVSWGAWKKIAFAQ
jgi:hypothetical protein